MNNPSQSEKTGLAGRVQRALRISQNSVFLTRGTIIHYPRGTSAKNAAWRLKGEPGKVNPFPAHNVPGKPYVSPWPEPEPALHALLNMEEIEAMAGKIAYSRAKLYFLGGAEKGKQISRGKNKGKFRGIKAREGAGIPLDPQAIEELKAAARAELIAAALEQADPRDAFKRGRNAAQKLLHNSTREAVFSSTARAKTAWEGARMRFLSQCEIDAEMPLNDAQPFWGEQAGCESRKDIANQLRKTRDAIRAYWNGNKSPFSRKGMLQDFRFSRQLLRLSEAGQLAIDNGDAMRKRCNRLAERVQAGRAILAESIQLPLPLPAPKQPARTPNKVATVSLPVSRGEVIADWCNRDSYVAIILSRKRATREEIANLARALAGKTF